MRTTFKADGAGSPRRCAIQTANGSIDAATIEAVNILRGLPGAIIAYKRMRMVIHESGLVVVGNSAQLLISAIPNAFGTMNVRPTFSFRWCGQGLNRAYATRRSDAAMPAASI